MKFGSLCRALALAAGLALAACSGGSDIASPGATNAGTPPGGGGGTPPPGGGGGGATCPNGTSNQGALGAFTICQLTGEILSNLTLTNTAGVRYRIFGRVDIGRDVGAAGAVGQAATLTIEPGVTLFGDEAGDLMIINRGSRIVANGTTGAPIVFTSREDVLGQNDPNTAARQWGGLIVLGRAPIKGCNTAVAQGSVDCQNEVEGVTNATNRVALYGGATPADNSGSLQFVQIRFPGAFLTSAQAGDDLNGLTMGGVGSGTVIDHVQVHNSGDDGIEIFGGQVSLKHVILTGSQDDSLDCDEGWTGNVQFLVVRQTSVSATVPDRLIECSNRPISSLTTGTVLHTFPTIANFTFIGAPGTGQGAVFNNTNGNPGGSGRLVNGVVTGSTQCLSADTAGGNPTNGAGATSPVLNSILFNTACTFPAGHTQAVLAAGVNVTTNVAATLTNGLFPGVNETAHAHINSNTLGVFFDSADYIGAFSAAESVGSNWAAGWSFQLLPNLGCPTGTTESGLIAGQRRCVLAGVVGQGTVPAVLQLTAGSVYEISGRVDVGVDRGAGGAGGVQGTLIIDPGVTLFGDEARDMVIVNRGSQIFASGARTAPVIFTSADDLNNAQANAITASREWGGLIILGRAPIKGCNTAVAQGSVDCQNEVEGVTNATNRVALYGGATPTDNSGSLQFVQIRYPGAFLTSAQAGDDLNGLTMGGVGSGTLIDNVQIHNSGDDGIEVFGGLVNMKHVIITGAEDDSFDCDEAYVGNIQFMITVQRTVSATVPDRLIECSNRPISSVTTGTIINTSPTIANFTFIGAPGTGQGAVFNNTNGNPGGSGRLINGVVTGSTSCLNADNAGGNPTNGAGGVSPVLNSILFNSACTFPAGHTQAVLAAGTSVVTNLPATLTGVFINGANETGVTATNANTVNTFFTATTWIGAVRDAADTWWTTWTCGLPGGTAC